MKRSLKKLSEYTVQAIEGEKGSVKNFLFDEDSWIIRYLDVELGNFFVEKRVLIPREQIGMPDWENKHFPIDLIVTRIEESPGLEHNLPVSRKYENQLSEYYNLVPYWPGGDESFYPSRESIFTSNRIFRVPKNRKIEENTETSLRSFFEVKGYFIRSSDDTFGHIEDLIIDDLDWQIVYVVLDTKNLVPWSKKVILPIEYVEEINFPNQEVRIELTKEHIKNAQEYDPDNINKKDYERELYDFYGRRIIM